MSGQKIAQTNQQQKSEKPQASGILQRAAVRSVLDDARVQSTDAQEALALSNSAFSNDFSQVPISTTKPQQIMAKLMVGPVGDKYEQEADRVAAQVVQRINAPASVRSGEDETVQRETMETKDNQAKLMRSPIPILQCSKGKSSKHDRKQGRLEKESGEERFIPPEADKPYSVSFNSKTTNPYTAEEIQELLNQYNPGDVFEVNPNRLRTMHAGISDKFGDGTPIDDTIAKLKSDKSSLKHLPPIKIAALEIPQKPWERQTSDEPKNIKQLTLFTEDHRRVVAAREAGVELLKAQLKATPTVISNYTTTNMGMSVEVRSYRTAQDGRHQGGNKSTFPGSGKVFQYKDEELQMKPMLSLRTGEDGIAATPNLEASINQARGGGQALADNLRLPMEQAFGADFSGVKVHTNAQSDQMNRSIQARAFTTGQDVFFRQGEYNPGSRVGQELLAHELTHVVQQSGVREQAIGEMYRISRTTEPIVQWVLDGTAVDGRQEFRYGLVKGGYTPNDNKVDAHIEPGGDGQGLQQGDMLSAVQDIYQAMLARNNAGGPIGEVQMRPQGAVALKTVVELLGGALGGWFGKMKAATYQWNRKKFEKLTKDKMADELDQAIIPEHMAFLGALVDVGGVTIAPILGRETSLEEFTQNMLENTQAGKARMETYKARLIADTAVSMDVKVSQAVLPKIINLLQR